MCRRTKYRHYKVLSPLNQTAESSFKVYGSVLGLPRPLEFLKSFAAQCPPTGESHGAELYDFMKPVAPKFSRSRSSKSLPRERRGPDPHPRVGSEPRRVDVSQWTVSGRPQASRSTGLRGGGNRGGDRAGRSGIQDRRCGQHHSELLAERLRTLRRTRQCPGACRDALSRYALLGRGGRGLDAVPDCLWSRSSTLPVSSPARRS